MAKSQVVKQVRIKVTKSRVSKGQCGDPAKCPIALGFIGAGFKNVFVGPSTVSFKGKGKGARQRRVNLPQVAQNFIEMFDEQNPVKPFEFTINIPAKILRKTVFKGTVRKTVRRAIVRKKAA